MPCNGILDESYHLSRPAACRCSSWIVESGAPLADTKRWRSFEALEFSVVIDVAMTETAERVDGVLPTSTQYEAGSHLLPGELLPSAAADRRSDRRCSARGPCCPCCELGVYNDDDLPCTPPQPWARRLRRCLRRPSRPVRTSADTSRSQAVDTGPALPEGMNRCSDLGPLTDLRDQQPESAARAVCEWQRLVQRSSTTRAVLPRAPVRGHLGSHALRRQKDQSDRRRAGRVPIARQGGPSGDQRRIYPSSLRRRAPIDRQHGDARSRMAPKAPDHRPSSASRRPATLDVEHGAQIRIITKAGEAISNVEISDSMLPGMVSLPNGQGLSWPGADADTDLGVYLNELTSVDDRDWFAGTPHHKHVGPVGEGVRRTCFDADPCPSPAPPICSATGGHRSSGMRSSGCSGSRTSRRTLMSAGPHARRGSPDSSMRFDGEVSTSRTRCDTSTSSPRRAGLRAMY